MSNQSRFDVASAVSWTARLRRWSQRRALHFLLLALVTTSLSFALNAQNWTLGSVLDAVALDSYFKLRGAASAQDVAEKWPHTRDIVLVETTHRLPRPVLALLLRQLKQAKVVAFDMMFVDEERLLAPDGLTQAQKSLWYGEELRGWRRDDALLAGAMRAQSRVVLGTWPEETRFHNAMNAPPNSDFAASPQGTAPPNASTTNNAPSENLSTNASGAGNSSANNAVANASSANAAVANAAVENSEVSSARESVTSSTRLGDASDLTWQRPPAILWQAAKRHAHLLVAPDARDNVVRHVRLYDGPPNARQPALGLALAAALENVSPRELARLVAQMQPEGGVLKFGKRRIRYARDGEIWVDFHGARAAFDGNRIAYNRVLDADYSAPEDFKGKIVLIGEASETSKEIMKTPFGLMPGMQIHAEVAATLLNSQTPLQSLNRGWTALLALGASLILLMPLLRFPLWTSFLLAIVESVVLFFLGAWIFAHFRLILPLSVPLVAMFFTLNGLALYEYRRARATLGSFIGTEMVPHALGLFAQLRLGGRTEEATAWFCDLRGYSSLSEHMTAQNVSALLAQYTETIVRIVQQHGGRPIDYQGDGVFVLFEETATRAHAESAVRGALETQIAFGQLHDSWELREKVPLEIAIGMATGPMMIGLVGSSVHLKMGAVGDAVNVAARVQALSRECGFPILLARSTYDRVLDIFPLLPCGTFAVHGRTQPLEVFGLSAPTPRNNEDESHFKDQENIESPQSSSSMYVK